MIFKPRQFTFFVVLGFLLTAKLVLATDWKDLAKGLDYQQLTVSTENSTVIFDVLKINPKYFSVKPIASDSIASVKSMAKKSGALAVINANFFDTQGKSLGLVKINSKILNPKKDISWWGILCLNAKSSKIVKGSEYNKDACEQAIQTGPRLVVGGTIPPLKENLSRKTAVGLNSKGEIIFVTTHNQIPIQTLAEIFKKPETENGLNCPDALNLDGGSSTQIFVHVGDFVLDVPSYMRVPVGLGVFPK